MVGFQERLAPDAVRTVPSYRPVDRLSESHDTPRLVTEAGDVSAEELEAEYRFRYLFAAFFSSGVMLPMGYEYGFAKAFDVAHTVALDWEKPRFDLSPFIADVNAMKASVPALNEENAERLVRFEDERIVALVRDGGAIAGDALAVFNATHDGAASVATADIEALLAGTAREVTPGVKNGKPRTSGRIELGPRSLRVFTTNGASPENHGMSAAPADAAADARATVIERVRPQLDEGRHAIKRIVGDRIMVTADVFRDGHDAIDAALLYRERGAPAWREEPLIFIENDEWKGSFEVTRNARYEYTIEAWPDAFGTWHHDTEKKRAAGQPIGLELREGRALVDAAHERASGQNRERIAALRAALDAAPNDDARAAILLADEAMKVLRRVPDRSGATRYSPALPVIVDRRAAQFAAWYEFFPRSQGAVPGVHGTFADAATRLPEIRALGFDVVYLPPIHPIGHAFRKGKNNTLDVGPDDPGSPWAIGNETGGHMAVEPKLGTLEDFDRFVAAAKANNLEVALDYALQCSPDHPYLKAHPEWFTVRPDGSIKYAENPPKKYQDIVNFNWFGPHATELWNELRDVVEFWIEHGVKTFRVDNPHTKPFAFWTWMIDDITVASSGDDLPRRSLYAPEDHERTRERRLLAIVYVLYVAQHESGPHGVRRRTRANRDGRLLPAEFFSEHAGHSSAVSADGRPRRISHSAHARSDAFERVRDLQRLRTLRKRGAPGARRISGFGEVRNPRARLERPGQH